MKKFITPAFKLFLPGFLLFAITVHAQKLPNVQQISVRAPDNIKIDGKAMEWNNKFQAYNNATDVFYILSNDDSYLYLTVQSADNDIINRIVGGGITLTIQKSGKKDNKNSVNVTYPVAKGLAFSLRGTKGVLPDTTARVLEAAMTGNNKKLDQKCTTISVTGVAGLDTLISVYNEDGIKAACKFDINKVYTLEVAIALKHLGISTTGASKFAYRLCVNGMQGISIGVASAGPNATPGQMASTEKLSQSLNAFVAKLSAPTDFWGEYTLATK